jgi:flagellar basal body rod protein FlgB
LNKLKKRKTTLNYNIINTNTPSIKKNDTAKTSKALKPKLSKIIQKKDQKKRRKMIISKSSTHIHCVKGNVFVK